MALKEQSLKVQRGKYSRKITTHNRYNIQNRFIIFVWTKYNMYIWNSCQKFSDNRVSTVIQQEINITDFILYTLADYIISLFSIKQKMEM